MICFLSSSQAVYVPLFLYSITAAMFLPVFQSFLYMKVCLNVRNTSSLLECSNGTVARDRSIHEETNIIMLIASVCMCVSGIVASGFIGRIGDRKSRKTALLIPFVGLLLADVTLIFQTYYIDISPYFFAVSELIFGIFGGYMAIISSSFAFLTSEELSSQERGKSIARMEGLMGLGGMIGFLVSSQLAVIDYFNTVLLFLIIHCVCFVYILFMRDQTIERETVPGKLQALQSLLRSDEMRGQARTNLFILFIAFGTSFFAFIGSAHILFFYLKQRFMWDAEYYSYLRAGVQACSTVMALLVYPWLKNLSVRDSTLAVVGLTARAAGKAWIAVAWSMPTVFTAIIFEMFSRFPATALRSLIASNTSAEKRGGAFAVIGALEAGCNLLAAVVFHSIFPWSLSFLPQLSFVIMAVLIIPPTILVWYHRNSLDSCSTEEQVVAGQEMD